MQTNCPYCAELILIDAKKCRYCGEWLKKKTNSMTFLKSPKGIYKRGIILIALIASVSFFIYFLTYRQYIYTYTNSITPKTENGLMQRAKKQYTLLNTEDGMRKMYQDYLAPDLKKETEDAFVAGYKKEKEAIGYSFENIVINSVFINGDTGYVERTLNYCKDPNCNEIILTSRGYRKYVYYDNKWLMSGDVLLCPRTELYQMPSEFERALKLIIQRLQKSSDPYKNTPISLDSIINCVQVSYSKENDEDLNGAEGVFKFLEGQSSYNLEIIVSPRYSNKDDLITAVLLFHEITHAYQYALGLYAGNPPDTKEQCYLKEAMAFSMQNTFINLLNDEERSSIFARSLIGGSPELQNIVDIVNIIPTYPGTSFTEQVKNYVKSNPYYIKQCSQYN